MEPGDRVRVESRGRCYEGILMPQTTRHLVIKLDSGYNIGLDPAESKVTVLEGGRREVGRPEAFEPPWNPGLPRVSILSTGGTIASRVDYRTGAVTSQFTAQEILQSIPELTGIANYNAAVIYSILSENMQPSYWQELASAVYQEIKNGAEGVMVTHGTDTMTYTAAALSFMLRTPVPVVLVGSQRSADRPSSDNAMNAVCAARVAVSDIAETTVVMHATTSDDYCFIHRGTKVRKNHTSRRDAFQSVSSPPIGRVDYPGGEITTYIPYKKRGEVELELKKELEPDCALLKFTPGTSPEILRFYLERFKGVVLEGTGLGHVSSSWIPYLREASERGVPVVVTSQCFQGRVCDRVYDTGRDMLRAGVVEGEDMLPEVALVKLMWVLGQTRDYEEACRLMTTSIAGEITSSTRS